MEDTAITDDQFVYFNEHLDLVTKYVKLRLTGQIHPVTAHLACISVVKPLHAVEARLGLVQIILNIDVHDNNNYSHFDRGLNLLAYVDEHNTNAYVFK